MIGPYTYLRPGHPQDKPTQHLVPMATSHGPVMVKMSEGGPSLVSGDLYYHGPEFTPPEPTISPEQVAWFRAFREYLDGRDP